MRVLHGTCYSLPAVAMISYLMWLTKSWASGMALTNLLTQSNTDIILVQGLSLLSDHILTDTLSHVNFVACTDQMSVVRAICDNWVNVTNDVAEVTF